VYCDAESAGADPVSQFPSSVMEPATLIVWPTVVVTISLNVTATLVAAIQADPVDELADPLLVNVLVGLAEEDPPPDEPPDMAISAQVR